MIADGSSVPIEVAKKTEQIVDMLRNMPNSHHLVTVIKRNLTLDFLPQSAKATGINAASLASVRKRCELICKRLLERILQVHFLDLISMQCLFVLNYLVIRFLICNISKTCR